jgi:hypothetical protein
MHRNAELIRKFYTSFGNRDPRGMAAFVKNRVRSQGAKNLAAFLRERGSPD